MSNNTKFYLIAIPALIALFGLALAFAKYVAKPIFLWL